MKRAVSISIGSSKRDKSIEIELLGQKILIERIGTDGDMKKAAQLYRELDGKVDAFGVGGTDLGLMVADKWYPLYSVLSLIRDVHITPVVDGSGLKTTLEKQSASVIETHLGTQISQKRAFILAATDRWGMASGFLGANYECIYGDMMFSLGLPFPLYKLEQVERMAALLMPIAGRIPFKWLYPTGKDQEKRTPKYEKYFDWASVIAGDCHYITRYMPDRLDCKLIVTNTTTREDIALFQSAGIKYVVTTTPVLDGRSFGTNMMEAAIIAATGRKEPVDYTHPGTYLSDLEQLLKPLHLEPQIMELN